MKNWTQWVLALTFFCALPAHAQKGASNSRRAIYRYLSQDFKQLQLAYTFWQENIDGTSPSGQSELLTHFEGLRVQGNLVRPRKNLRWAQTYGAALSLGMAKGQAFGAFSDVVANQPWIAATVSPGLVYRTSLRTELAVSLPLSYRFILWQLKSSSDIELERESSFSYGISGALIGRLTRTSALHFSVTHQQAWNTTQWGFGWQYDIR